MDINRLLTALKDAMEAEMTGHQFYLHAAKTTRDRQGQETFSRMAQDELDHFQALKIQYLAVLERGKFDQTTALFEVPAPQTASPIFSSKFKETIGEQHFEMSALSVGMQLELNAINHYRKSADESEELMLRRSFCSWRSGNRGIMTVLPMHWNSCVKITGRRTTFYRTKYQLFGSRTRSKVAEVASGCG